MILGEYLLGFLEDNVWLLYLPKLIHGLSGCTDYYGYPLGHCESLLRNNQPFPFLMPFLLAKILNPVLAYNISLISGFALNLGISYLFFKRLFGRFLALLLTVIFTASPYFAYQSRSHIDLIQFWPAVWFFYVFFFSKSKKKPVYLGLLLTLTVGLSNYMGYYVILFLLLYLPLSLKRGNLKGQLTPLLIGAGVFGLSVSTFIASYVFLNYSGSNDVQNPKVTIRPFEDFVIFSSRPWYYLLPSVDSPIFGRTSQTVLNRLSAGNNYLTQNYFKSEHSAAYLGWVNMILALAGILSLFKQRARRALEKLTSVNYLALSLTIVTLALITMPPWISISGISFYTPSYIVFKFFPMFRVLSRLGILILFLTLIFTGYGYKALFGKLIEKKLSRKFAKFILLALMAFSIAEFFIPLKITHVGTPPAVYSYIGTNDPLKSPMVIYPYNKTNESVFWLRVHNQPIINPKGYSNSKTAFTSEEFTKRLITEQGLVDAQRMGAKYLVYFYEADGWQNLEYFNSLDLLTKVADFNQKDSEEKNFLGLIRIVEAGTSKSNSASLYRFR